MSYPPNPYPLGPTPWPPMPPRRTHPLRAPLIALAVIIALAVAVALVFALSARSLVTGVDDVSVGQCVRVTDTGDGTVKSTRADCDGAEFTFYVASRSEQSAIRCATVDYSRIGFRDGGGLCLAPNWRVGHCYEVPRGTGPASTYRERGCSTRPTDSDHPILEITVRRDGTTSPRCTEPDASVSFALPKPVGYCYTLASDMPA